MSIDAFIFKLLLLSIPGFITYTIYRKTTVHRRENKNHFGLAEFFIVIIFSFVNCIVYDLFIIFINRIFQTCYTSTISKLFNVEIYSTKELVFLCISSLILGFLFTLLDTKKIINKIAIKLRISQYNGDTDVWTAFCSNKETNWIYVRDNKQKLIYFGNLEHYSDPGEDRELILTDIQVFTEDGEFCYNCPVMYISRQSDDITIEIPSRGEGDGRIIGEIND